jgi:hypothetical protein
VPSACTKKHSSLKKEGVMPRTMKIMNGPSFKSLAFDVGILNETRWTPIFTMSEMRPTNAFSVYRSDKFQFCLSIFSISRISEMEDEFVLLGFAGNWVGPGIRKYECETWYYVLHYNARTRKGPCVEYSEKEFFGSEVIREMFKT